MEFKINTQTKTIAILQKLSVKELKELLDRFNITDEWKIDVIANTVNSIPSITSGNTWIQPYKVTTHFDTCSCNPKNGGNGICGCILNNPITY